MLVSCFLCLCFLFRHDVLIIPDIIIIWNHSVVPLCLLAYLLACCHDTQFWCVCAVFQGLLYCLCVVMLVWCVFVFQGPAMKQQMMEERFHWWRTKVLVCICVCMHACMCLNVCGGCVCASVLCECLHVLRVRDSGPLEVIFCEVCYQNEFCCYQNESCHAYRVLLCVFFWSSIYLSLVVSCLFS